ncbi:type VI secretion system tip protein VgrG [Massilia atriviolacea]|uniref:Type VI secretion system tip protein VgrG n=1 Tax=Massilia atriviolacea TaxID=2495579 RepID=A0A430HF94_9BURK|nr:type VI secretion system Vgr family protein [Massilia atriviolacea]RSZ56181.1 type VI secretion system tip protein VgrG [Massilia atriviolacea]
MALIDRSALLQKASATLALFSSDTRLYGLTIGDGKADLGSGGLLVEAFCADDALQGIGGRDIIVVSTDAHLDLALLLGQAAKLDVTLADGSRTVFAGEISEAAMLGSEGGLARYRVRMSPWMFRLSQVRNSRVWQDKSVIEIVDAVFEAYVPAARWRWSEESAPWMAQAVPRSYCCQYRETDLAFVERLLGEEGLSWRFEQTGDGPCMVLFADSTQLSAVPDDQQSAAGHGVRFHGARAREQDDTVQALQAQRRVAVSLSTVLSYDYKAKRAVSASVPSKLFSGSKLPALESYDIPGQYSYTNLEQARRYATLQMQAREARSQLWRGRSTVRTLRAGTRMTILNGPLQQGAESPAYTMLRVVSVGVNNLPSPAVQALAELFGPIPELLQESVRLDPEDFALVLAEARKSGYANCFEALASEVVWRPQLAGSDGRTHPKPTAQGAQSAIVIGPDGSSSPQGADELYCDQYGRVRIRYHWQEDAGANCWVRVAQRSAVGGMGSQFLPRIGQEVLVQFIENDIDRPLIVGALYNGQGEGGIVPTPGGRRDADEAKGRFEPAHDHATSDQGNLAGGNSPLWHGASTTSAGHRNSAAQWGVRSKEFGGSGYNQLLFDDTDAQGRVQLKASHAGTELTLGHLIHNADNFRGSLRGVGAELRTDAYGAVRGGAGLLVSSYRLAHAADARDPAGDNSAGIAMLKHAVLLGETFSKAAREHKTVEFGAHQGPVRKDESVLDEDAAPLKAILKAVSGMVSNASLNAARDDAAAKVTRPDADKLPHETDPVIAIAARGGLGVNASSHLQFNSGETITVMSGQDSQFVTEGQLRIHSRQTIGMLGGAVEPGADNMGLQLIAGKGMLDIQAQSDTIKIQALADVDVLSTNAHIDWASPTSISLSTAGGANITISGGNIAIGCPGTILVKAGIKTFDGPGGGSYPLPKMPREVCVECMLKAMQSGSALALK